MSKDFMSNVSHEIKTPVAAIVGFSEMLLDGGHSAQEQKEYLSYIYQESQRLSRMSENMLHMSRLDHQNIVDMNKNFKVDEQIRRCIISLGEKWHDRDIQYELQLEQCSIVSDYDLLFQLWTNLIDNAIKYSDQKCRIWITTKVVDNFLQFTIRDEGIGISKEKLSKIYDKFYQCDEIIMVKIVEYRIRNDNSTTRGASIESLEKHCYNLNIFYRNGIVFCSLCSRA